MHSKFLSFSLLLLVSTAATLSAQENGERSAPAKSTSKQPSADRKAILALLMQLEAGFNANDAKAMAACWTESGEFIGPTGARADGREAVAQTFAAGFDPNKGLKLVMHLLHLRVVNEHVAMLDVVPEFKAAGEAQGNSETAAAPGHPAVMVLVKQDGHWLIESARSLTAPGPAQASHLKDLDWLVGDWATENSKTGISLKTSCDWNASQTFLIRRFKLEGKGVFLHGGTEIIGWDPRAGRIRSWTFDSDGGFGEHVWIRDGKRWIIKFTGTLADGGQASSTHFLTMVDGQTFSMQSKDRFVNTERQPDLPETFVTRQPKSKSSEPMKMTN